MPHFDVHSFRKRMKKWTFWTFERLFSAAYPFASKTEVRNRHFSARYPFKWREVGKLFRPIPVHFRWGRLSFPASFFRRMPVHARRWLVRNAAAFFRSIPVHPECRRMPRRRSFSGRYPFTLRWSSIIFVLECIHQSPVRQWQEQ